MFIYFYHLAPSISHLALALYYQDLSGLADSCRTVGKWLSKMAVSPTCFLAQLCPAHSKRSDKYKAGSNLLLWFFRFSVLWPYMANLRAKALYSGFVHSDHESWQVSCTYLERLGGSCCLPTLLEASLHSWPLLVSQHEHWWRGMDWHYTLPSRRLRSEREGLRPNWWDESSANLGKIF